MRKKKEIINTLSKEQVQGLRSYRRATVLCLNFVIFLSFWFKVSFHSSWHFNDVLVEVLSLFILLFMGILANIKNDFPIFNMRRVSFTKDFLYSIVLFFTLLFFFVLYKNITEADFISYLASLSFHDLITILVFLFPVFLFLIFLIYIGFRFMDKDKSKEKFSLPVYQEKIEKSLDIYKDVTIKAIFIIMCISIWIKVGFLVDGSIPNIIMELSALFTIFVLFIVGNKDNKLNAFYSRYIYLDRYFVYSLLLPYVLIILYAFFSKDFRIVVGMSGFSQVSSFLVSMMPLFAIASFLFYKGVRLSSLDCTKKNKVGGKKVLNKIRSNALVSFLVTFSILSILFYYSFTVLVKKYNVENLLQIIMLFIPLFVILYLIVYSCIREMNK